MLFSASRVRPRRCADLIVSSRLNLRNVYEANPKLKAGSATGLAVAGIAPLLIISAAPDRPRVLMKSFLLIFIRVMSRYEVKVIREWRNEKSVWVLGYFLIYAWDKTVGIYHSGCLPAAAFVGLYHAGKDDFSSRQTFGRSQI